jgi:hypothetical protein
MKLSVHTPLILNNNCWFKSGFYVCTYIKPRSTDRHCLPSWIHKVDGKIYKANAMFERCNKLI